MIKKLLNKTRDDDRYIVSVAGGAFGDDYHGFDTEDQALKFAGDNPLVVGVYKRIAVGKSKIVKERN